MKLPVENSVGGWKTFGFVIQILIKTLCSIKDDCHGGKNNLFDKNIKWIKTLKGLQHLRIKQYKI